MSSAKGFLKYNILEHFRYPKTYSFISKYISIYEQLNNNANCCNWRYRLASNVFYLLTSIVLINITIVSFVDLDRLHAALYVDMIQFNGQNKKFSCNYFSVILMWNYLYYKCYFDYPPSMLKQLKSINDNETRVLFPWPIVYKGTKATKKVRRVTEKMLRVYIIYNFTEGIFLVLSKK